MKQDWEVKPGSPEFRLAKVDGRATVDVGLPSKFANRLGPGWRTEQWGGRAWLEISGHGVAVNKPGKLVSHAKHGQVYECECVRKVKGKSRGELHRIVPGSTEYQIEWASKADVPTEGYVDLAVDFSGDLTWYKQPPLTQEEIDEGAERPENVVNSYAIYGTHTGRILRSGEEVVNFETGKFGHLYRSQLIDAAGNRLWLDQTAPLPNPNRLRVYLDNDWLSGATYPVVLDPTFGYTSVGDSFHFTPGGNSLIAFGQIFPAANGNATDVSVYTRGRFESINVTNGVYTGDGTNPTTLLRDTGEGTATTSAAWITISLDSPASVSTSVGYWAAFAASSQGFVYYDTGASAGIGYWATSSGYSSGSLPSSPSISLTYDQRYYSGYITYEEGAAATGSPAIKRLGGVPYAALNRGVW